MVLVTQPPPEASPMTRLEFNGTGHARSAVEGALGPELIRCGVKSARQLREEAGPSAGALAAAVAVVVVHVTAVILLVLHAVGMPWAFWASRGWGVAVGAVAAVVLLASIWVFHFLGLQRRGYLVLHERGLRWRMLRAKAFAFDDLAAVEVGAELTGLLGALDRKASEAEIPAESAERLAPARARIERQRGLSLTVRRRDGGSTVALGILGQFEAHDVEALLRKLAEMRPALFPAAEAERVAGLLRAPPPRAAPGPSVGAAAAPPRGVFARLGIGLGVLAQIVFLGALLLFTHAVCRTACRPTPPILAAPPAPGQLDLVDQASRPIDVRLAELTRDVGNTAWIAGFVAPSRPERCRRIVDRMLAVAAARGSVMEPPPGSNPHVQFVLFVTEPGVDVKAFGTALGIPPAWLLVSSRLGDARKMADFASGYSRAAGASPDAATEGERLFLVDIHGNLRGSYAASDDARLAGDVWEALVDPDAASNENHW
jgi:hypothetical protein